MFQLQHIEAVAAARTQLNHGLDTLTFTYCSTWEGSAAQAASDQRLRLLSTGSHLYGELFVLMALLEELTELQAQAVLEASVQGVTG